MHDPAAIPNDSTAARILAALQPYRLKREPSGQYRADCPWRSGSNSHSLRVVVRDGEHGAWNYFAGDGGGSLYDLANRLGVPLPERNTNNVEMSSKRRYTSIADYAQAHGLTAEDLHAAGWHETTREGRPALAFETPTGTRYRFLDGEDPRYKSPTGYRKAWYRLDVALALAESHKQPLVLCNGEISTIAAQYHGVAAVALAGGSEANLPPFLVHQLREHYQGRVIIAFDCDQTGRKAAEQTRGILVEAGFDVAVVDLGGSDGFDLADFVRLHGDTSAAELVRRAEQPVPTSASTFPILTLPELWALPAPRWLLRDVIAAGKTTMIWGASGSGKTFYGVDLAMQIARTRPVLYVAAEDAEGVSIRTEAWIKHHAPGEAPQFFAIIKKPRLLDTSHIDSILVAVKQYAIELVIFDTLGRTIAGANENDRGQMRLVTEACDRINAETESAVALIHHGRKDSATFSGAGTLKDDAYTVIEVSTDGDGLITVENEKAKNSARFEPQRYRLLEVAIDRLDPDTQQPIVTCVLVPAEQVLQTSTELSSVQRKILETLDLFEEFGAKATQVISQTRIKDSTFYRTIKELRRRGLVAPGVKGDPYSITEAGRQALHSENERPTVTTKADIAATTQPNADQIAHLKERVTAMGAAWGWEYMDKCGGRDKWPMWARMLVQKIERETP